MKIYRIECLIDSYQHLQQDGVMSDDPEDFNAAFTSRQILSRCQPAAGLFTPPVMYSPRPKLPRPDFWKYGLYFTFALPEASADKARRFLEDAGELLPVPYKAETFSVLNVLKCVDYWVFSEKVPGHLRQESLDGKIPDSIFRDSDRVYLHVAEKTGDPDTEFKAFVEREMMTGLRFREVWNSET